jgi:hypothetical protein
MDLLLRRLDACDLLWITPHRIASGRQLRKTVNSKNKYCEPKFSD